MSDTRETILTSIDRSSESIPRPALWLRGLVGSALALPFLVGLGLGNRTAEPPDLAVKESGYIAMNKLQPASATSGNTASSKKNSTKTRPKRKAPKPAKEISKDDELAALFGIGSTADNGDGSASGKPEGDGSNTTAENGLSGLDIAGWPGETTTPTGEPTPAETASGDPTNPADTASADPGAEPGDPATGTAEPEPPEASDLSALMNYTTEKVSKELQESFPAVKQGDTSTLRYANGSSVSGQILSVGPTLLSMNVNSQRVTVYFNSLEPSSRILVDRAYRQAQVMKEVEKRMLDAIK